MTTIPPSRLRRDITIVEANHSLAYPESEYYDAIERLLADAKSFCTTMEEASHLGDSATLVDYDEDPTDKNLDALVNAVAKAASDASASRLDTLGGRSLFEVEAAVRNVVSFAEHVRTYPEDPLRVHYDGGAEIIVDVARNIYR